MNKRIVYWGIIFLTSLYGCTSKTIDKDVQANNDSIKKYLDLAGNYKLDAKLRNKYNDKAFSLVDLSKNDTLTRWYLYKVNLNLNKLEKGYLVEKATKKFIYKSLKANDTISLSRLYKCLGLYYMYQSKNELAIKYFFKAKKGFASVGFIKEEIKVMMNIALTQSYANDFLGSNKTSYQILKIEKNLNFKKGINNSYTNIGNNLSALKNDKSAIDYYKKANYDKEDSDFIVINNNIASSYIFLEDYEKAFIYLKKNLDNENFKTNKWENTGVTNSLLGLYYLKINKPKLSHHFLKKAENIFNSRKTSNGENYNEIYFSEYYSKVKDTINAIKAGQRAVNLSKTYNNLTDELYSLSQLINVDKKKASIYAQEYIRINDSLQIAERRFRDKFANIEYEVDEVKQEKDTAIKQKWLFLGISGVVILIIVLILIITKQRSKQKELQFLQSQQKANEEIYDLMLTQTSKEEQARQSEKKRIALELHDGVMNKLASTRLNLNMLSHQKDEETINKCLAHIEGIYKIEQEIRNIAHNLNLEIFNETNSYVALLNDFIATQNAVTSSPQYKLEIGETINWVTVSSVIKMNLYRIIQEASHNSNKHAQATNVIISLILDENNICLSITDNGKGFDIDAYNEGIGLKNIKHRVESLNGKFVIQSINNKSTSINIAIPVAVV